MATNGYRYCLPPSWSAEDQAIDLMKICGESIRVMHPLFHAGEAGSIPSSPLKMRVVPIGIDCARALNEKWHSCLPRIGTGFVRRQPYPCFGAADGDRLYAVAIWSNPVARNLPQQSWLELRRFAISPDAPRYTASWMLAWMARLLWRGRPKLVKLISYQALEIHRGIIYRAAGWHPERLNRDGNWTRRSRYRPQAQILGEKMRWAKDRPGAPVVRRREASQLGVK